MNDNIQYPLTTPMNLDNPLLHVTDSLYSITFQYDEDILEVLCALDYSWDAFHHRSLFLAHNTFRPPTDAPVCTIEAKYFIPSGHVDWFKNPIPSLDAFEGGNMANISPTIKIDISVKPNIMEEITLGAACSPEEIVAYKSLFKAYQDVFSWSYIEMLGLDPVIF
jgi:hypothetical protein